MNAEFGNSITRLCSFQATTLVKRWRENNTTDGFDPLYFFNFSGWIKTDLRSDLNEWMIETVVLMHFWLKLLISPISCMNICTPNLLQTADSQQLSKSAIDMLLGINSIPKLWAVHILFHPIVKIFLTFLPHLVSNCPAKCAKKTLCSVKFKRFWWIL